MIMDQIIFVLTLFVGFFLFSTALNCTDNKCKAPTCVCAAQKPPGGLNPKEVPQFVLISFDTVLDTRTYPTLKQILRNRTNAANGCPIAATFFVSHVKKFGSFRNGFTDYSIVHRLWRQGHEIAVHSISHRRRKSYWKEHFAFRWRNEMEGMRRMISKYANIPSNNIKGHRAPFLQTAGDTTFQVLRDVGFKYDSSFPTRSLTNPPLWPYTLNYGFQQDCVNPPCPEGKYPGFFEIPLVDLQSSVTKRGLSINVSCVTPEDCTKGRNSVKGLYEFLILNFMKHYSTSRAPFSLYFHETWLKSSRKIALLKKFIDHIRVKKDVYIVSVQEVLNYLKRPVYLSVYLQKTCLKRPKPDGCPRPAMCRYRRTPIGHNRNMVSCVPCPESMPWLRNINGIKATPMF